MKQTAEMVTQALWKLGDPEKASLSHRFFKAGPGEYAEGDKFMGVTVPLQRKLVKEFKDLALGEITSLLESEYHECRLTGLLILVHRYQKAKAAKEKEKFCEYYLSKLDHVNNWDLVDSTAYKLLGAEIVRTGDETILDELASSEELWRERVAVIATLALIKSKDFEPTLRLCKQFLDHEHDLIHKATGWMLREAGKVNKTVLETFLARNSRKMPRTMLRYAIERLPKAERDRWMGRK